MEEEDDDQLNDYNTARQGANTSRPSKANSLKNGARRDGSKVSQAVINGSGKQAQVRGQKSKTA